MTALGTAAIARYPQVRPLSFVWSAWRGLTVRHFRYAVLFGLAVGTVQGIGAAVHQRGTPLFNSFIACVMPSLVNALVLLLCLAVAENINTKRIPRWLPYVAAATLVTLLGAVLGHGLSALYVLLSGAPILGSSLPFWIGVWLTLPPALLIYNLAALGYMHFREAAQRTAALRNVQLERVRVARHSYESRLRATQARVDPQFLFDTLAHLEQLYETDSGLAERMLDDLIVYLRAALPSLDQPHSMLGTELTLARAWLGIMKMRMHGRLEFVISAPEEANDARIPPMVVLPLLDRAIQSVMRSLRPAETIEIQASVTDGRLRVSLSDSGPATPSNEDESAAATVRERLQTLYGAEASLAFRTGEVRGAQAVVEIPCEHTDGNHR